MKVVGDLPCRVMKQPGMFDDKFDQVGQEELVVAKGWDTLWHWPVHVWPMGIVWDPFEGDRVGGEQKTAIG